VLHHLLQKLQAAVKRTAIGSALIFIAGLVGLAAVGFAIAAIYEALAKAFASQTAAAITAVILLLIAGIIALIGATILKGGKSKPSSARKAKGSASRGKGNAATELAMAQQLIARGRWSPLAMALIAGFAFGISPEIRREAARLLRREAEHR